MVPGMSVCTELMHPSNNLFQVPPNTRGAGCRYATNDAGHFDVHKTLFVTIYFLSFQDTNIAVRRLSSVYTGHRWFNQKRKRVLNAILGGK